MAEIGVEITAEDNTKKGVSAAQKNLGKLKSAANGLTTGLKIGAAGAATQTPCTTLRRSLQNVYNILFTPPPPRLI